MSTPLLRRHLDPGSMPVKAASVPRFRALLVMVGACALQALLLSASFAQAILDTATFGGHTYHLVAGDSTGAGISWEDAEAYAVSLGGHLVAINDAAEDAFVSDTFGLAEFDGFKVVIFLHIGLTDQVEEGAFVWTNGDPVTYTNWAPGEPNDFLTGEDYGAIWGTVFGNGTLWNDTDGAASTDEGLRPSYGVVELAQVTAVRDILGFFDSAKDDGSLLGSGPGTSARGRLGALENQIEAAGDLIDADEIAEACDQLLDAFRRTDGFDPPPDFATGDAARELAILIGLVREELGCD